MLVMAEDTTLPQAALDCSDCLPRCVGGWHRDVCVSALDYDSIRSAYTASQRLSLLFPT